MRTFPPGPASRDRRNIKFESESKPEIKRHPKRVRLFKEESKQTKQ